MSKKSKDLSNAVGDFIRYWGFRRIHGQLWTQIYLSAEPLSGAELVRGLGVSKALVSPALSELLDFKLIYCVSSDGRTKKYRAHPEVFKVIQEVLKTREKLLIKNAQSKYDLLKKSPAPSIDPLRLQSLGEMIAAAQFALDLVIQSAGGESLDLWSLLEKTSNP